MILVLALVGAAAAAAAAVDGSVALVLTGVGLVLLAAAAYLADVRAQASRRSLELVVERGLQALRQELAEVAARQDVADVTDRLDRLDARLDRAQRRLVATAEATRLETAERAARMVG
ncbi:MAG TPA: hypothetical protein VKY86_11125 [Promicromonospora sp.]|nr:hypothetical protein [Promicromonospora sp.]